MLDKSTVRNNTRSVRGVIVLRAEGRTLTLNTLHHMVPGEELADREHPGVRVRCVAGDPPARLVFFHRARIPDGALHQFETEVLGAVLSCNRLLPLSR